MLNEFIFFISTTGYLAETMVLFKIHNTLLCIKSKELKISDYDSSEPIQLFDASEANEKNEIDKIKAEIDKRESRFILDHDETDKQLESDKTQTPSKLTTIQEENLKNLKQSDNRQMYAKKSYALEFSTRSRSEANLMKFNEIEYNPNPTSNHFREYNNNYQSNPHLYRQQASGGQSTDKYRKIDNELQLKELVNELGSFKERLVVKHRKNSILKRVKSLSKINFTKNLHNEILKDEIEFDLQKIQKPNKKKLFKRRISGIF